MQVLVGAKGGQHTKVHIFVQSLFIEISQKQFINTGNQHCCSQAAVKDGDTKGLHELCAGREPAGVGQCLP